MLSQTYSADPLLICLLVLGGWLVMKDMNQKALDTWKARIPVGRLGEPDEIAQTVAFIAQNELVTGVVLEISGGVKI